MARSESSALAPGTADRSTDDRAMREMVDKAINGVTHMTNFPDIEDVAKRLLAERTALRESIEELRETFLGG